MNACAKGCGRAAQVRGFCRQFEALIAAATTVDELDAIAKELKTAKLGSHATALRSAWTARKTAIETPDQDTVLDDAREADE